LSGEENIIVYVQLLNEGTVSYRPTIARRLSIDTVKLLEADNFDPDEEWEFPVGSIVRIEKRKLSAPQEIFVATALIKES
jgi:hypothetical protein